MANEFIPVKEFARQYLVSIHAPAWSAKERTEYWTVDEDEVQGAPTGVWAVYYYDYAAIISAVYADELEARRHADPGFHHVVFLPWGVPLAEVLK